MIDPEAKRETNITIRVSRDFKERVMRVATSERRDTDDWVRLMLEQAVEHAEVDDERQDLTHERVMADSRAAGMLTPAAEAEAATLSDMDFVSAQERHDRGERW